MNQNWWISDNQHSKICQSNSFLCLSIISRGKRNEHTREKERRETSFAGNVSDRTNMTGSARNETIGFFLSFPLQMTCRFLKVFCICDGFICVSFLLGQWRTKEKCRTKRFNDRARVYHRKISTWHILPYFCVCVYVALLSLPIKSRESQFKTIDWVGLYFVRV